MNSINNTTQLILPTGDTVDDADILFDQDLNSNNFSIINVKSSTDPSSATNLQQVNDMLTTFKNNLIVNTSKINVDSNLNFGSSFLPQTSKVPVNSNDVTNKQYVNQITIPANRITTQVQDSQIQGLSYSKLTGVAVTNSQIQSVDYSKITNTPTSTAAMTSTLTVDSNLNFGGSYLPQTSKNPANSNDITNKQYVDQEDTINSNKTTILNNGMKSVGLFSSDYTFNQLASNLITNYLSGYGSNYGTMGLAPPFIHSIYGYWITNNSAYYVLSGSLQQGGSSIKVQQGAYVKFIYPAINRGVGSLYNYQSPSSYVVGISNLSPSGGAEIYTGGGGLFMNKLLWYD